MLAGVVSKVFQAVTLTSATLSIASAQVAAKAITTTADGAAAVTGMTMKAVAGTGAALDFTGKTVLKDYAFMPFADFIRQLNQQSES